MNSGCSVQGQIWTCDFELKDDLFSISPVLPPLCLSCLHQRFLYSLMKWQLHLFQNHFSLDLPQWLSSSVWLCCRWGSVPRNLFLALKIKSPSCCWGNLAGWWETIITGLDGNLPPSCRERAGWSVPPVSDSEPHPHVSHCSGGYSSLSQPRSAGKTSVTLLSSWWCDARIRVMT